MARKIQVPAIGGIRKVITPGGSADIASLQAQIAQLNAVVSAILAAQQTPPNTQGNGDNAFLTVGPGMTGGGALIGNVPIGLTGPLGGATVGLEGEQGEDGPIGPPGPPGATGARGPAGEPGEDGMPGEDGPPGPTGATGATGPTGPTGPPGPPGSGSGGPMFWVPEDGAQGEDGPAIPGRDASALIQQRGASWSNGTSAIVTPTVDVPFIVAEDCTIKSVTILTNGGTGSCAVDIWKIPVGSYPPTVSNTIISGGSYPTISSGVALYDTVLSGFATVALSKGDTVMFHLRSSSVFTEITIVLELKRVGSTSADGYTDARAVAALEAADPVSPILGQWTWTPASTKTAITVDTNGDGATPDVLVTGSVNGGIIYKVFNNNAGVSATAEYVLDNGTHQAAVEMLGVNNSEDADMLSLGTNANAIRFGFGFGAAGYIRNASGAISMTLLGQKSNSQVDMSPDSDSFTGTLTGMSGATTGTVTMKKMGNYAVMTATITGTSNANTMTMTGLPSYWQPVQDQLVPCVLEDNGVNTLGAARITPGSGTVTFHRSVVSGTSVTYSTTGFTTSGTKGLNISSIMYRLL